MFPIPPNDSPTIVTLTGPSCAGKTTLEKLLVDTLGWSRAISHTTRARRPGESDGAYYFVSEREFDLITENDGWLERVRFANCQYGLSEREIGRLDRLGKPIVVVCEPNGAKMIRDWCYADGRNILSVYVDGVLAILVDRMLDRHIDGGGSMRDPVLSKRLASVVYEYSTWKNEVGYDLYISEFDEHNQSQVTKDIARALEFSLIDHRAGRPITAEERESHL